MIEDIPKQPVSKDLKAAKRTHRRIEAMLIHPHKHLVMNGVYEKALIDARDALRRSLGYNEGLARVVGQMSVDEEICVRTHDDGGYVFALQDGFCEANFET